MPLALEPDLFAFDHPLGQGNIHGLAARKRYLGLAGVDDVFQRGAGDDFRVGAFCLGRRLRTGSAAETCTGSSACTCAGACTATAETAENVIQNIVETTAATGCLLGACTAEVVISGKAVKTMRLIALLAVRIDFSAVELGTLFLVADNFIGLICFGKTLCGRRIILVLIRMVFLASFRKAFLISLSLADFATPRTL